MVLLAISDTFAYFNSLIPIILALIIIAFILYTIYKYFWSKKRGALLKSFALAKGFTYLKSFSPFNDAPLLPAKMSDILYGFKKDLPVSTYPWMDFGIFNQGWGKKLTNFMKKESELGELLLMDFRWQVSNAKSSNVITNTLIIHSVKNPLSKFVLDSRSVFDKVGAGATDKGINIDSNPGFSKKYLLKGDNETAVMKIFNKGVLDYFAKNETFDHVESNSKYVLFYYYQEPIKFELVEKVIMDSTKIMQLFTQN